MNEIVLDAKIQCSVTRVEESDTWIVECSTLSVIVEGDSLEEACSLADEAISLLFTDLLDEGDLDLFLKSHGWKLMLPAPEIPTENVRVPWELVVPSELVAKGMSDGLQRCVA